MTVPLLTGLLLLSGAGSHPVLGLPLSCESQCQWDPLMACHTSCYNAEAGWTTTCGAYNGACYNVPVCGNGRCEPKSYGSPPWVKAETEGSCPADCRAPLSCLEFELFFREPGPFPDPFNNVTQNGVNSDFSLLVIDSDLKFQSAAVSVKVRNVWKQEVWAGSLGTFESGRRIRISEIWDGRNNSGIAVANGFYTVQVKAVSSLCGTTSTTLGLTVVH